MNYRMINASLVQINGNNITPPPTLTSNPTNNRDYSNYFTGRDKNNINPTNNTVVSNTNDTTIENGFIIRPETEGSVSNTGRN